jgi:hypothetical protein
MMYAVKVTHNAGLSLSRHTIRLTALTGCAATEIGGDTVHEACHLLEPEAITNEMIATWKDTRMLIVEVTFSSYHGLEKLDKTLRRLTEC